MSARRGRLGRRGEQIAARYLEARGHRVQARNWRCRLGEIDLVTREGDCLVVVEVRSRSSRRFGAPEESVDTRKQARLQRLAQAYVQQSGWPGSWRIDVVAIDLPPEAREGMERGEASAAEIRHYRSAVGP